MKTSQYSLFALCAAAITLLLSLPTSTAAKSPYLFPHYLPGNKSFTMTTPTPEQRNRIALLGRLYANLSRSAALHEESSEQSDTLRWSKARTLQESLKTFDEILEARRELAQQPAQPLVRELQVQRQFGYYSLSRREFVSAYHLYMELMLEIYREARTTNDPAAKEEKSKYEQRILKEIDTSREQGFVKESMQMLLSYADTKEQERADYYRTQRKQYEKYDEVVLLDLALYKASTLQEWEELAQKFFDDTRKVLPKEMQRMDSKLVQQWTKIRERAKGTPYADKIEQQRETLLPQRITIEPVLKEVSTGGAEVSITYVIREPLSIEAYISKERKETKIKTLDTLKGEQKQALIGRKRYTEILPAPGRYVYKAVRTRDGRAQTSYAEIAYSKIGTSVFRTQNKVMIRTYDMKTGAPLEGLKWWITDGPPPMGKAYTTDKEGFVHIRRASSTQRMRLSDPRLASGEVTLWVERKDDGPTKVPDKEPVQLYFDRPIYRYGQEVQIGIVSKTPTLKGAVPAPKQSGKIALKAWRQGKEVTIATQQYYTNEQAVAQLSFRLPQEEELSGFHIAYGKDLERIQHLQVEAYKLHHLNVTLDSIPNGIVAGTPLVIHGKTTDMSGELTPAEVEITIREEESVRSYKVSSPGLFRCETESLQELRPNHSDSSVEISVQATDALGQVAHTRLYVRKAASALPVSANSLLRERDILKERISIRTDGQPYRANLLPNLSEYSIRLELKDSKGKRTVLGKVPADGEVTWRRPDIPSGEYTLIASTTDKEGRVAQEESFPLYLYSASDRRLYAEKVVWMAAPKDTIAEDEDLTLLIGSGFETNLWLQISPREGDGDKSYSEVISLNNELRKVVIPARKLCKGDLWIKAIGVCNGITKTIDAHVIRTKEEKNLVAEVQELHKHSFLPGERLEKELVIKDEKGNPVPNVQAMITIYDKAVEEASAQALSWRPIRQWDYVYSPFGKFYGYDTSKGGGQIMRSASAPLAKEDVVLAESLSSDNGIATEEGPFVRKDFHETAYFNALLRSDSKGRVRLSFTLPDTQTQYLTRIFMFTQRLDRQRIQEFSFDVKAPLSIELGLPRFLLQGDSLQSEAVIRNLTRDTQQVEYTIVAQGELLCRGSGTLSSGEVARVPFHFTAPSTLIDTLTFEARVLSSVYKDGIRRKIPLHTSLSTYPVAIPLSLYQTTDTTLLLPKRDRLRDLPVLSLYCDPVSLVLSTLAGDHAPLESISSMDLFETLHRYVVYSQLLHFVDHHPAVVADLRRSLPLLELASREHLSHPDTVVDTTSARIRRLSDPHRLATLYRLLTDNTAMNAYVRTLEKRLQTHREPGGGWSYYSGHPTPWVTLYVLEGLTHVPAPYLSDRWSSSISRGLSFIEKNYRTWYRIPLLRYAVIRAKLGHQFSPLPAEMQKDLREEALTARREYANRSSYALIPYAEYVRLYESPDLGQELLSFLRDRSHFTHSDREKLALKLFLSREKQEVPSELIQFMLTHKQGTLWHSPYTLQATKLLLAHLSRTEYTESASLVINGHRHLLTPYEKATGEVQRALSVSLSDRLSLSLDGIRSDYIFGGIRYQVSEPNAEVTPTGTALKVSKDVFVRRLRSSDHTAELVRVTPSSPAHRGEQLLVRYTIETDRDLSLLVIDDPRPAGAEQGYDFRGYRYSDRLFWVYHRLSLKDRLYIDYLPRGRHVLEMDAIASSAGVYSYGPAVIASYFAPEFVGNSAGGRVTIRP